MIVILNIRDPTFFAHSCSDLEKLESALKVDSFCNFLKLLDVVVIFLKLVPRFKTRIWNISVNDGRHWCVTHKTRTGTYGRSSRDRCDSIEF